MRLVAFLDLDDTLFQSARKCPPGEELTPLAFDDSGRPTAFMTRAQRLLLRWLMESATVIPTTGRSLASFRRVQIAFGNHAILNHGGSIIDEKGHPDPEWNSCIRQTVLPLEDWLVGWVREAQDFSDKADLGVRVRLIRDFDFPIYASAKHPGDDLEALSRVEEHLRQFLERTKAPVYVAANGNNLAAIPRGIAKKRAVCHLMEQSRAAWGEYLSLGIGDSLSDLNFLKSCDWALIPKASQIFSEGLRGL